MNALEKSDMLRVVFDALPSRVFVVDDDVRIQEYNASASDLLMTDRNTVLKQRAGDILHCIHSDETPEGCGHAPHCKTCIIRTSVMAAFQGNRIVRRRSKIELIRDGTKTEIYALVTTSPFTFQNKQHALLVIEDISVIAELQRLVPICCVCRKVADDHAAWMKVEEYFKTGWDVDFSHGYCPDCFKAEMDKLKAEIKSKNTE